MELNEITRQRGGKEGEEVKIYGALIGCPMCCMKILSPYSHVEGCSTPFTEEEQQIRETESHRQKTAELRIGARSVA